VANQSEILLESGTNELEVVMFKIGTSLFGINVLKVREIINMTETTDIPNAHPYVEGMFRLREEVIPVVNLAKVLGYENSETPENDKFIIAELNQIKVAFRVHQVTRIYRISWENIEKPSELSTGEQEYANGIIHLEDNLSILIDFEKIVAEINPKASVNVSDLAVLGERERSEKHLVVAEDSAILRELLSDTLVEAGYENLSFFDNGKEAWDYFEKLADNDSVGQVDLLITDIEMPMMDGHHLTSKVREHDKWNHLPVVIFSSLISAELFHKGEAVGANAQVTKPEIVKLVKQLDKLLAD